ncbi:Ras-like GTP-binding protein RYL2 [Pseudocercospora fuligena]|uniref:Ras-like GTP-binding protein RYL2 n=1 Tax=Pseudocercospora fuligena TaxID=685502 RepID=A0A8H6VMR8_9PEZI|nr:Ras-like GTP-binding protein RYL2 [Pseudocercospora fuligena]
MASSNATSSSLEAKIVVLGSQGVGKTSLVHRFVKNTWIPHSKAQSTVGASFLTTRVNDSESGTNIRLQIWDTAGQERFRSISRLYYRGANAAILCYDVTSKRSFEEMGSWLQELRENCGIEAEEDMILHIVGTKSDQVAEDPTRREVPFERCIGYVAEQLYPAAIAPASKEHAGGSPPISRGRLEPATNVINSPNSNRSSGFWGQEQIWDCCHEISAKDGEGIEEVFRVITRKLVDQHAKRLARQQMLEEMSNGKTPGTDVGTPGCYFDLPNGGTGSFRVGHGDKRKSWLGSLATPGGMTNYGDEEFQDEVNKGMRKGRCC